MSEARAPEGVVYEVLCTGFDLAFRCCPHVGRSCLCRWQVYD